MLTPLEADRCGKKLLNSINSSYVLSVVLFIQTRTIDIRLSFAYNFSRYP